MAANTRSIKRIIVCCDGTWMDSDSGYTRPTIIPYHPNAVLQTPSNVTRITRAFKRYGRDGKHQIIYYHSGVGSGGASFLDSIYGGFLGAGISENVREAYSFLTANYSPGDEIILIGFSRGAFTARSVAGLVRDIGLLTREGMKDFFAIYKDTANRRNLNYHDIFPAIPFEDKPRGPEAQEAYRERLVAAGLSRETDGNGRRIHVKAVGVWDTVGSLGIPNLTILAKLGLPHSTKEFKFYDTALHGIIEHAFQALALEEHRTPFSPAVWERPRGAAGSDADLRQVWFPGTHSAVGGGYDDQEIANISLAWMMDQLSSIGVTFKDNYIDHIYNESKKYYIRNLAATRSNSYFSSCLFNHQPRPWAIASVYDKSDGVRPYGLGQIYESEIGIWDLAGKTIRTPGLYTRMNPDTGLPTKTPLSQTNERIHSSVRLRLKLEGLSPNDKGPYQALALTNKKYWKLTKQNINIYDPIGPDAGLKWGNEYDVNNSGGGVSIEKNRKKKEWDEMLGGDGTAGGGSAEVGDDDREGEGDTRWVWVWVGPEDEAPRERIFIEENLGPYERRLLALDENKEVSDLVLGGGED